ncbi:phage holin [Romboutsia maritimum]|uniref:Phage holin n=1 Tax=Romboutsia maritimum TaxID=2020948 RepID=A0A371IVW4_9FIRM|nr:phage holin [Romboutsia maritimum]RDY24624.1 phage holin [Romboutsia maritimum]
MDGNLINILASLITAVISVGGVYLIKFLGNKIGNEKLKNYYILAKTIVMSIEQLNPQLDGLDKKDLAINKIVELSGNKIKPEEAETLIEAAVYEVKKILLENIK